MSDGCLVLVADRPEGGPPMFAGVDPSVRYVEPRIGDMRLMALLAPFPSEEAARAALEAAGGVVRP